VKGAQEIEAMVAIRNQIQFGRNIVLDFASCGKLSLNAMVFLGALASLVRHHGGSIGIGPTIKPKLLKGLREHGVMGHLGNGVVTSGLPFGHYASIDKSAIMQFLQEKWLGVGAVRLSEDVQTSIMGAVWEVYANAFEHANSPVGIVNCSSFDRIHRRLHLAVVDLGVGIPSNVRTFFPGRTIGAVSAMKWAFAEGCSTRAEQVGYSRGLGLAVLKEFIQLNGGFMEVYSNDGYVKISKDNEVYRSRSCVFGGTLVSIVLSADERFYYYAYEASKYGQ